MRSACKYKRSKNANGKNGNIAPKVSFFKVLISGSYRAIVSSIGSKAPINNSLSHVVGSFINKIIIL